MLKSFKKVSYTTIGLRDKTISHLCSLMSRRHSHLVTYFGRVSRPMKLKVSSKEEDLRFINLLTLNLVLSIAALRDPFHQRKNQGLHKAKAYKNYHPIAVAKDGSRSNLDFAKISSRNSSSSTFFHKDCSLVVIFDELGTPLFLPFVGSRKVSGAYTSSLSLLI